MDGIHDLGGKQGFGRIDRDPDEPPFHEEWEGRAHALGVIDPVGPGFRHAIEVMDPIDYLTTSYYEHWLHSLVLRGARHGHFSHEELADWERRIAGGEPVPVRRDAAAAGEVRSWFGRAADVVRHHAAPPRHAVGERVRVIQVLPAGHTRCPGYLRGAVGVVERVHAPAPLLDVYENEDGRVEPQSWYTVTFDAASLWEVADPRHVVNVDLWESHLEDAQ
jgi:nitrile hydratase beta subunit